MRMLSPAEARTLLAVADALLPPGGGLALGARDVGAAERMASRLERYAPALLGQVRGLLRVIDLGPVASRHGRRLGRLDAAARERWIAECLESRLPWRRGPALLLKVLLLGAFCSDGRVEEALGYDRRCLDPHAPSSGPRLEPLQYPAIRGHVEVTADACVVGSGAGGAVVARELAAAGLRVVILEEGAYFSQRDFEGPPMERVQRFYRNAGGTVALGRPPIPLPVGKCVGGTTVVNSGTCFRTPDHVLREWESHAGLDDVAPEVMAPYFEEVERALSVRPAPWSVLGKNAELFDRGVKALGLHGEPILRNIDGCRGCGQCAFGCPSDAKQAMHLTYLPTAVAAGAALYARCRVDRIRMDGPRPRGVDATLLDREDDHEQGRLIVRAPLVIVAAGALHTPGLLWRSGLRHPGIGRNLRIHPAVAASGYFREEVFAWRGTLQSYMVDHLHTSHGVMLEVTNPVPGITAAALPGAGAALKDGLARMRHAASVGIFVSDTGAGRVRTLPRMREPVISYALAPDDLRGLLEGVALAAEIFFAAGAESVYTGLAGVPELRHPREAGIVREGSFGPSALSLTGFHPMGTVRMGGNAEAPVDARGAVRGSDGLYVADASLFPSCVGVNPQMTIMAFATRIARRLARRG